MSIIRTMTTGASGLRAESEALTAVSDNIANVNTFGFKRERAVFEDVLGRSVMGANAMAEGGAGSRVSQIQQMWTQGALVTTGNPTDLALSGDGLFMVNGTVDGQTGNFYTRAGQFNTDANGYLVNPDGLRLQGYTADATGAIGAQVGDLRVDGFTLPATATTTVTMGANLNPADMPTASPWDPTNATNTSSQATTVRVFDSLGAAHNVEVYFVNNGAAGWDWHAMVDGGEVGGTAGTPTEIAAGHLTFGPDGSLASSTVTSGGSVTFNGASAQALTFNFGSPTGSGGTGFDGVTGLASQGTSANALSQDGFPGGAVQGMHVDADGTITGIFGYGEQRALGRVAVARFANDQGLARTGHNLYQESQASGQPLVGDAGSGGRGSVVAGSLESSNVDLGSEFVDLIAYQRGFSANSKIITTADEMYQELVQLRR
jgi:flagellar hook protein FlgE